MVILFFLFILGTDTRVYFLPNLIINLEYNQRVIINIHP